MKTRSNKIENVILDSFVTPETHPTEERLLELVKRRIKTLANNEFKTEIKELLRAKKIYSVLSTDKKIHYGKQKGQHYHYICVNCGKVRDFFLDEGATDMISTYLQRKIHSYGQLKQVNLSLMGQCHECQRKN